MTLADLAPYVVPGLLCFGLGAGSAFLDFHRVITDQAVDGRRPPMHYLATWETTAFFIVMGVLSVAFFTLSVRDSSGWLGSVLRFGSDNIYLRAVLIGLATNVLVRMKLIEVRGNKIGLEYFYDLSRTWTVGCYQFKASAKKQMRAKQIARQVNSSLSFEDDLAQMVRGALVDPTGIKKFDAEVRKLEGMKSKDLMRFRELMLILAMDNLGIRAVKDWAKRWNKEAKGPSHSRADADQSS